MYHRIMPAKQLSASNRHGRHPIKKMYLILLSAQLRFLNLSAKSGISATSKKENMSMKRKRKRALNLGLTRNACWPIIKLPQKSALAGVGSPMKLVVWRLSRLNLARRNALKAVMMNAV